MRVQMSEAYRAISEDAIPTTGLKPYFGEDREITARWNGAPYALCHGKWTITVGGEKVNLPEEVETENMGTFGTYSRWYFGGKSGWEELWEDYEDGLQFDPWVAKNRWWLNNLHLSNEELCRLYNAISAEDWRHSSCGGCI